MWTVLSTWNTSNWFQSDIIRRFFAENSDLWRRCLLGECFIVLLLTFFEFVWNRPKSWKGSGNLSPEWLERRKYESCWLVWHYSFLYCRKFRPLTNRNELWRRFLLGECFIVLLLIPDILSIRLKPTLKLKTIRQPFTWMVRNKKKRKLRFLLH